MHKGYAFVQFANPLDARSACLGEDNRVVLGQTLGEHWRPGPGRAGQDLDLVLGIVPPIRFKFLF